jgi:hypothetical protein
MEAMKRDRHHQTLGIYHKFLEVISCVKSRSFRSTESVIHHFSDGEDG